ncbi:MAG TPA: hypothetical protein VK678_09380 [Bradyrhizobium sp.]|nr:hypothetical protein [Bradyrhizobium sp.]
MPIVTAVIASVVMPIHIVMAIHVVMATMLAADVVAVNPLSAVVGPVARDPNHFPVARPIAGTMAVIRPIAYLNAETLRTNRACRNKNAGRNQGDEQKFVFNHTWLIRAARACCVPRGTRMF